MSRSVIVTCAITGSIHTPSQSPYLPLTPAQIVAESIAAAEAGASVLHLHARNPADGSPTADPEVFMQFLPEIRRRCSAIINITTGGGPGMTLEERLAPARAGTGARARRQPVARAQRAVRAALAEARSGAAVPPATRDRPGKAARPRSRTRS